VSSEAPDLQDLERRRLQALVQADVDTMEALHAEDYELINPGGKLLDRSTYLGGVASGELDYHVFEAASIMRVKLSPEMGLVRYQARIEIERAGGRDSGLFWHTDAYQRRGRYWQAVWSHATRIRSSSD
jgi:hypothetical protein